MRRWIPFLLAASALAGCSKDTINNIVSSSPPASIERVSGNQLVGAVGTRSPDPLIVKVRDTEGNPAHDVQVIFRVESGDAVLDTNTVRTDASGIGLMFFSYGPSAGPIRISASATGLSGSPVGFDLMSVPQDAAVLAPVSGFSQSGTVGKALTSPVIVRARDMFGNGVEGVSVDFSVASGTMSPPSAVTDTSGYAGSTWTLGTTAGPLTGTATSATIGGFPLQFSAIATADSAESVVVAGGNAQSGVTGAALPQSLAVRVTDTYGNNVTGTTVAFVVTQGGGSVAPASPVTQANGIALTTFTLGTVGPQAVTATVQGLAPVNFTATAYEAVQLLPPAATLSGVQLRWTRNRNSGFTQYGIYRSTSPTVTNQSPLIQMITVESDTAWVDATAAPGQTYYYRVYVSVSGGASLGSNTASLIAGVFRDLPATGIDMAVDGPRDRIYVSLPTLNEVVVLDAATLAILDRVIVGTRPHGLSLSMDGQRLYCALNTAGAVAVLDLTSMLADTIQVGTELGDARAWDVLEVQPNVLLVTSNPSSSGFAYVVRIALDFANGHSATRVASGRIIRAGPEVDRSSTGSSAYVGEGFSPNSLYKLDMGNPAAPIVLEDQHGSVSGTDRYAVSPDDSRIYLRSGQILSSATFNQTGTIGSGIPVPSPDGTRVHVAMTSPLVLRAYNTTTLLAVAEIPLADTVDRMVRVSGHDYLLALSGDRVYALPIP